jgi:hypothetical protein
MYSGERGFRGSKQPSRRNVETFEDGLLTDRHSRTRRAGRRATSEDQQQSRI